MCRCARALCVRVPVLVSCSGVFSRCAPVHAPLNVCDGAHAQRTDVRAQLCARFLRTAAVERERDKETER
eukprot:6206230-Pleurochrysis_carterae.AAC.6